MIILATRKKSVNDFKAQLNRIFALRDYLNTRDTVAATRGIKDIDEFREKYNAATKRNDDRVDKAYSTTAKYVRNIKNKKSYQNIKQKSIGADPKAWEELKDKAFSRKYSANTYMGKNSG